jgi:hypothetical protein
MWSEACSTVFDRVEKAKPGHWTKLWETSLWFPQEHPVQSANVDTLGGRWLQEEYFKNSAQHGNQYSMRTFSTWLRSGILDHTPSNTILGGPFGLKWPVLQLTCAYWTLIQLNHSVLPPYWTCVNVDIPSDLQVVRSNILWLLSRIESSVHLFVSLRQKQFENMSIEPVLRVARRVSERPLLLAFLVSFITFHWYLRTKPKLQESHSDAASTPSPSPTHNVHPILKRGREQCVLHVL